MYDDGEGENRDLYERTADTTVPDPHESVADKIDTSTILRLIDRLPPREAKILRMRFGLAPYNGTFTLEEVATEMENVITPERVRQLEQQARGRLRLWSAQLTASVEKQTGTLPLPAVSTQIPQVSMPDSPVRILHRKESVIITFIEENWEEIARFISQHLPPTISDLSAEDLIDKYQQQVVDWLVHFDRWVETRNMDEEVISSLREILRLRLEVQLKNELNMDYFMLGSKSYISKMTGFNARIITSVLKTFAVIKPPPKGKRR